MNKQFERTEIVYSNILDNIQDNCVAIIGIGGVGGYACEALARFGIKKLILVDYDIIDITNINRQVIALHSTIGLVKVDVMKARIKDINPECEVITYHRKYLQDDYTFLFDHKIDFLIDACDNIDSKIHLIKTCLYKKIKFISSMGAANKTSSQPITICDITKTYQDRLAKSIRNRLKKDNVRGKVPVCFSYEDTSNIKLDFTNTDAKLGSLPYVPSTFGLRLANYCIEELNKIVIKDRQDNK